MQKVRFFAAARAATACDSYRLEHTATTLADLEHQLRGAFPTLTAILPRCSYLVDGIAARDRSQTISAAADIDVLPPFAGG